VAFPRRLTLLLAGLALGLTVVWVRVFSLQVASADRWRRSAHEMRHPGVRVDAPRGRILDADGRVLVSDEAALGLCFVAGDWERRERLRCRDCGSVTTRRPDDRAAARRGCSCRAGPDRLEPVPDEDLAPLEDAIGLERGALARWAADRVRRLDRRVETLARQTIERLDLDEFRADDVRRALRDDHFRRETPLRERDFGAGWKPGVADLPVEAIRLLELDSDARYRGFSARASLARRAAHRGLLGQCLGKTMPPDERDLVRLRGQISRTTPVGRTGVEAWYDDWLRGVPGVRYEDDGSDEDVPTGSAPEPGADVRLALELDACVEAQRILDEAATEEGYAAHGPPSGGFVVMLPDTGRIPAWADAPRYDPVAGLVGPMTEEEARRIREGTSEEEAAVETFDLAATPSASISRVARVGVEPGSAMKMLTALFALGDGRAPPGVIHCTGKALSVNDKPGCSHVHGTVGYEEAMCFSCNRWMAYALARPEALRDAREVYPAFARSLGIGVRTGVDVVRETPGVFDPTDRYGYRHLAIGQGPVTATPLQMARIAALVQNGGRLVTPRLATSVGAREIPTEVRDAPVSASAVAAVRRGMAAVVEREGGTAHRAFADVPPPPGVRVYGKTGTAQVPDGGHFDPDRVEDGPWHHWFVGFAERGNDRIAFAMVLYARREAAAGATAARACARFVQWWYSRGAAR
jgi:cell division protein FtsI/penicillin-binding protein 2